MEITVNRTTASPSEASLNELLWERLRESMKGYNWLSFFAVTLIFSLLYSEYEVSGYTYWAVWLFMCQAGVALITFLELSPRKWIKPYAFFFVLGCLGWSLGPVILGLFEYLPLASEKMYGILLLAMAVAIHNPLSYSLRLSFYSIIALLAPFTAYQMFSISLENLYPQMLFVATLLAAMITLLLRSVYVYKQVKHTIRVNEKLRRSRKILKRKRKEISELQKEKMELHDWDAATGLYSINGFSKKIDGLKAGKKGTAISVKMPDLDHVKNAFGPEVENSVLLDVASKLKMLVRESDFVCRAGATSFLAYFPGRELSLSTIESVMWMPAYTDLGKHVAHKNVGVAYLKEGDSISSMIKVAVSNARYAEKRKRDKITTIESDSGDVKNIEIYSRLKFDLPEAIENDALHLVYQPQHQASDGAVVGFEALARWNHPQYGPVSPATFIPVAEEAGLMMRLGAWVIERGISDAKKRGIFARGKKLSLNIAPVQFLGESLVPFLRSMIEKYNVPSSQITLEITESTFMDEPELYLSKLSEMRDMGFSIALDDFGTGYSSLCYLTQFPVDLLKIDRSLVSRITVSHADRTLFGCILDMTAALNIPVVVEGVEEKDQLALVREKRGEIIQGFIFSPGLEAIFLPEYMQKDYFFAESEERELGNG